MSRPHTGDVRASAARGESVNSAGTTPSARDYRRGVQGSAEEEVTTLYRELQRASSKLEIEKSNRRRIDGELQQVKSHRTRDAAQLEKEVEMKTRELNHLRHEKNVMREWLERGVEECRKVAQDMLRIKQDSADEHQLNDRLADENKQLREIIEKLTKQIQSYQVSFETENESKATLLRREAESTARMETAEMDKLKTEAVIDDVKLEVLTLKQHLRGANALETAFRAMAKSMLHVTSKLQESQRALTSGDLDEGIDERYISPVELEQRLEKVYQQIFRGAPVTASRTPDLHSKPPFDPDALIREVTSCSDGLSLVANDYTASIKSYIAKRVKWKSELHVAHENQMDKLHRDYKDLEDMAQPLRRRIDELEDMLIAERRKTGALEEALEPRREVLQSFEEVTEENARLKSAAQRVKIDWGKIEESRHRFLKVQEEVLQLRESYQRLDRQNHILQQQLQQNQNMQAMKTTNQPINTGSVSTPARRLHKNREAFELWRTSIMSHQV